MINSVTDQHHSRIDAEETIVGDDNHPASAPDSYVSSPVNKSQPNFVLFEPTYLTVRDAESLIHQLVHQAWREPGSLFPLRSIIGGLIPRRLKSVLLPTEIQRQKNNDDAFLWSRDHRDTAVNLVFEEWQKRIEPAELNVGLIWRELAAQPNPLGLPDFKRFIPEMERRKQQRQTFLNGVKSRLVTKHDLLVQNFRKSNMGRGIKI